MNKFGEFLSKHPRRAKIVAEGTTEKSCKKFLCRLYQPIFRSIPVRACPIVEKWYSMGISEKYRRLIFYSLEGIFFKNPVTEFFSKDEKRGF